MTNKDRVAQVWDEVEETYNVLFDPQREWRCEQIIADYGQERFRAGTEAAQDIVMRYLFLDYEKSYVHGAETAKKEIPQLFHSLLAEQGEK